MPARRTPPCCLPVQASPGTLYVSRCAFENNTAGASGGALAIEQAHGAAPKPNLYAAPGEATLDGMLDNYSSLGTPTLEKILSYVEDNSVAARQSYAPYFPPRMADLTGVITYVIESNLTANRAGSPGGAIMAQGTALVLSGSALASNTASAGGAVAALDCVGSFNTYSSSFANNSASGFGGAVAASSCNTTFNASSLDSNQGTAGGAVYSGLGLGASGSAGAFVLQLTGCEVSRNRASAGSGGGIMASGVNVTLLGGAVGSGNYAAMSGGGVAVVGGSLAVSGTATGGNSAGGLQESTTFV